MNSKIARRSILPLAALVAMPCLLGACDKTESKSKTESTKIVNTPDGTKKVTETTESKTTVDKK